MKRQKPRLRQVACALVLVGLSACSGMTTRERNTVIGAGVGVVGGSILLGGGTAAAVGGAVVGGVIGHEFKKR